MKKPEKVTTKKSNKRKRKLQPSESNAKVTPIQRFKMKQHPFGSQSMPQSPDPGKLTPFTKRQIKQRDAYDLTPREINFPRVICIEGNIGSGKSTLLKNLEDKGYTVIQEPVNDVWVKYLGMLYGDMQRWGMTFQFEVQHWYAKLRHIIIPRMLEKIRNQGFVSNKDHKKTLIIVERSAQSALFVFGKNLLDGGLMNKWEFSCLERMFAMTVWKPRKTLYLHVDPDTCYERVQKRDRKGETGKGGIQKDLMVQLHEKHEDLFVLKTVKSHKEVSLKESTTKMIDPDVVILDGHQSVEKVCEDAIKAIMDDLTSEDESKQTEGHDHDFYFDD